MPISKEFENVMTIDPEHDGIVMLSSDVVFFNDAQSRSDGRKIYHIFEKVLNEDLFEDEKLCKGWDSNFGDKKEVLFSKATENNLQNIQEVLENNGIIFDEWCPPKTPIVCSAKEQSGLSCEDTEISNTSNSDTFSQDKEDLSRAKRKKEMFIEVGLLQDENSMGSNTSRSSSATSRNSNKRFSNSNKDEKDKWFFCLSCSYVTQCEESYKIHTLNHNRKSLNCNHCNYVTLQKSAFKAHQLRHIEDKLFGCIHCDFKSNYKWNLKTHLFNKHKIDARDFTDDMLRQLNYVRNTNILDYLEKDNDSAGNNDTITDVRILRCSTCDFNTKSKKLIKRHVMTHFCGDTSKFNEAKSVERKLKCSKCEFRTNSKSKIRKHVIIHCNNETDNMEGVGVFNCSKCDFVTQSEKLIKKHILFHKKLDSGLVEKVEDLLKCCRCDYTSEFIEYMHKHLKKHKSKEKIYRCSKCDFKSCRSKLKKHMLQHLEWYDCCNCSYSSQSKYNLNRHELTHLKPKPFKCSQCKQSFLSKRILNKHNSKHHNQKTLKSNNYDSSENISSYSCSEEFTDNHIYRCPKCTYTCSSKIRIKKHIKLHTELKLRECSYCRFTTTSEAELKKHELRHIKKNIYRCSNCKFITKIKKTFEMHKLGHLEKKLKSYDCLSCNFSTTSNTDFKKHSLVHVKKKGKLFSCSKCNFTHKLKAGVKQHELSHLKDKLYKCSICKYSTNYKGNIKMHEMNHMSVKKYNCEKCNYSTNIRVYLQLHKVSHLEQNNLKCSVCDFTTTLRTSLRKHIVSDHPSSGTTRSRAPKNLDPVMLHCAECSYTSFSRVGLNQHKLTHSNIKRFKCLNCNYATNFKGNLNLHEMKHRR